MRKLLLVIDMQNDFIDGALGTKEAEAIVENVRAKIRTYPARDVIATLDTHEADYLNTQEGRLLPVEHCIRGTEGWQLRPELAELLNAKAVENLAVAMKEVDGLLVHISTDYVFGGEPYNTPCREDQKGTPTGVYGLTKLHGEEAVLRSGVRYVILRTAWLYSEYGKNFVKTMLQLTATRPQLKVVFDQVGTPTYAGDLASAILTILSAATAPRSDGNYFSDKFAEKPISAPTSTTPTRMAAIYHYSNEGVCSWYDFAKTIAEMAGHTDCEILPCHSDEFPSKVKRPAYSVLDKTLIKATFGLTIPYWTDSLRRCLQSLV